MLGKMIKEKVDQVRIIGMSRNKNGMFIQINRHMIIDKNIKNIKNNIHIQIKNKNAVNKVSSNI